MQKLRSYIYESFFNPVLHFLPLFLFMIIEDLSDIRMAWLIALSLNLVLLVYVYLAYKKLFNWFVGSTLIFIAVATILGLVSTLHFPPSIQKVEPEYIVVALFGTSLVFRKKIEEIIKEKSPKRISMTNNLNELFRMIWILGSVVFVYAHTYTILVLYDVKNVTPILEFINNLYIGSLVFIFVYEFFRVSIVRIRLLKEEWWPIVNENGDVIGNIQQELSLHDQKKYIHPVVRVMLVVGNKILLQKRKGDMMILPDVWDTAISNHVRMGETVEQCVERTSKERYQMGDFKTLLLSKYILEAPNEFHYAFLFVTCKVPEIKPNPVYVECVKWWTLKQIEDNLQSGIFSDNFLTEFDILKRSGIFESESCDCDCPLKDVITDFRRLN